MLQSFLTPSGLSVAMVIVVGILGLWGFKYFEPRKPPETLQEAEARRKADKEWFQEQWDLAILENTAKREAEIHRACVAEFVLREEYRRDADALQASMHIVQTQLVQHSADIAHMQADIKRTAEASEKTNQLLQDMGKVISSIDGSWREWKQQHGPLNGGT